MCEFSELKVCIIRKRCVFVTSTGTGDCMQQSDYALKGGWGVVDTVAQLRRYRE